MEMGELQQQQHQQHQHQHQQQQPMESNSASSGSAVGGVSAAAQPSPASSAAYHQPHLHAISTGAKAASSALSPNSASDHHPDYAAIYSPSNLVTMMPGLLSTQDHLKYHHQQQVAPPAVLCMHELSRKANSCAFFLEYVSSTLDGDRAGTALGSLDKERRKSLLERQKRRASSNAVRPPSQLQRAIKHIRATHRRLRKSLTVTSSSSSSSAAPSSSSISHPPSSSLLVIFSFPRSLALYTIKSQEDLQFAIQSRHSGAKLRRLTILHDIRTCLKRRFEQLKYKVLLLRQHERLTALKLRAKSEYAMSAASLKRQLLMKQNVDRYSSAVEHAQAVAMLHRLQKFLALRRAFSENALADSFSAAAAVAARMARDTDALGNTPSTTIEEWRQSMEESEGVMELLGREGPSPELLHPDAKHRLVLAGHGQHWSSPSSNSTTLRSRGDSDLEDEDLKITEAISRFRATPEDFIFDSDEEDEEEYEAEPARVSSPPHSLTSRSSSPALSVTIAAQQILATLMASSKSTSSRIQASIGQSSIHDEETIVQGMETDSSLDEDDMEEGDSVRADLRSARRRNRSSGSITSSRNQRQRKDIEIGAGVQKSGLPHLVVDDVGALASHVSTPGNSPIGDLPARLTLTVPGTTKVSNMSSLSPASGQPTPLSLSSGSSISTPRRDDTYFESEHETKDQREQDSPTSTTSSTSPPNLLPSSLSTSSRTPATPTYSSSSASLAMLFPSLGSILTEPLSDTIKRCRSLSPHLFDTLDETDYLELLPLLPPITRFTLRELNMDEIISNIQLRHDFYFDANLQFKPNIEGDQGERKHILSDLFWSEIEAEIRSNHLYRVPLLLFEIRNIVVELLPYSDAMKEDLERNIDVRLIAQQIEHGVLSVPALMQYLAQLLRANCAPARDGMLDEMIESCMAGRFWDSLKTCFDALEMMKLDYANHQLHRFRPHVVDNAISFESNWFKDNCEETKVTMAWISDAFLRIQNPTANNLPTVPSTARTDKSGNVPTLIEVYSEALMNLIGLSPALSESTMMTVSIPETLKLDPIRLITYRNDWQDLTIMAALLIMFRQVAGAKCTPASMMAMKTNLWVLLNDAETSMYHIVLELSRGAGEIRGKPFSQQEISMLSGMLDKTLSPDSKLYAMISARIGEHLGCWVQTVLRSYVGTIITDSKSASVEGKISSPLSPTLTDSPTSPATALPLLASAASNLSSMSTPILDKVKLGKHGLNELEEEIKALAERIAKLAEFNYATYFNIYAEGYEEIRGKVAEKVGAAGSGGLGGAALGASVGVNNGGGAATANSAGAGAVSASAALGGALPKASSSSSSGSRDKSELRGEEAEKAE
ncbi:hypothetical protein HDU97_001591 [Phlyctochytrium planicorne]|nr:hypothetical protein HDU97_001591 [Phlyctochytrium planicorne]